jgi:zinc transport system permease protein
MIIFYYNELLSITFDEDSAKASGINTESINTMFVLLTAVTVVLSMKVVGIMLISALLIFPAVTALQIARSFKAVMLTASLSAVVSVVSGIVVSFSLDLPTGATIVLINFIFFLTGLTYRRIIKV